MSRQDCKTPPIVDAPRRNSYKCVQCRRDKQRCTPVARDWDGQRQNCDRCMRLGHACGPSERVQRTVTRRQSPGVGTRQYSWDHREEEPVCIDTICNDKDRARNSPRQKLQYLEKNYQSPEICYSPLSRSEPDCRKLKLDQIPSFQPDESLYHRDKSGSYWELKGKTLLARLGDLNATREVLRKDLGYSDCAQKWLGAALSTKVVLEAYIRAVEAEFQHTVQEVLSLATNGLDHLGEVVLSELRLILYRFAQPPTSDRKTLGCIDYRVIQQALQLSRKNRGTYSDADYICGSTLEAILQDDAPCLTIDSYIKATNTINLVLSGLVLDDIEHGCPNNSSYHPGHIAFKHGHTRAAFALWTSSEYVRPAVDILGRTSLHLAVYASDVSMLRQLLRVGDTAGLIALPDSCGITPLQAAACQDNIQCFSLLLRYGGGDSFVEDVEGRSVLALAARNGSERVVASMLRLDYFMPSLFCEVMEAIDSRHEKIAIMLLEHIAVRQQIFCANDKTRFEMPRLAAENAGLHGIVEKIRDLEAQVPSSQTALESLMEIKYDPMDTRVDVVTATSSETPDYSEYLDDDFSWIESFSLRVPYPIVNPVNGSFPAASLDGFPQLKS